MELALGAIRSDTWWFRGARCVMVCSTCGCEQAVGSRYCRQCGAALVQGAAAQAGAGGPYRTMMVDPQAFVYREQQVRVRQNAQPLGILWILFGVYRVISGVVGALVIRNLVQGGVFADAPQFLPHLLSTVVPMFGVFSVLMGMGSLITGWSLLARRPWARTMAIVFAILTLIKIPFGTVLGIYTLWVLGSSGARAEWEGEAGL